MKLELMWKRTSNKVRRASSYDKDGWYDLWLFLNHKDVTDINDNELNKSTTNKRLWKYYV